MNCTGYEGFNSLQPVCTTHRCKAMEAEGDNARNGSGKTKCKFVAPLSQEVKGVGVGVCVCVHIRVCVCV